MSENTSGFVVGHGRFDAYPDARRADAKGRNRWFADPWLRTALAVPEPRCGPCRDGDCQDCAVPLLDGEFCCCDVPGREP